MLESERFWPGFCRAMGLEALERDPRFDTHAHRRENAPELIRILDERFATRTRAEWGQRLDAEGCIWAPVQTLDEVLHDPQVHANGFVATLRHPSGESFSVVTAPMKFRRTPAHPRGPAPALGQHTEEALLEVGYTWEEILTLKEHGAIL
jgi:crotonobetainyl-CoA:carnitine CoA-transferase CaiB-like acyl-CoA transferase